MNSRIRRPWVAAMLLSAVPVAATAERTPAVFDGVEDERHFANLIEFPDIAGDVSVMMLCASQIEPSGKMTETGCMVRNNLEVSFAAAIQKATKKARLIPASIDGKQYKIYLQFRVEFIKEGDDKRVTLYSNPGDAENVEAYGKDYIAGQRVIGKEQWIKACPARADFGITARAYLGADGVASSVNLSHGYGIVPTGACQQAIIRTIESSLYTPAMAGGEAVPSAFVEPFGN